MPSERPKVGGLGAEDMSGFAVGNWLVLDIRRARES